MNLFKKLFGKKEESHESEELISTDSIKLVRFYENGKWGFMDRNTWNIIVPATYENYYAGQLPVFYEGFANVVKNDKWGFINETGKETIPLIYEWVDCFSEGLAAVKLNEKCGFIDKTGNEAIPFKYEQAGSFFEGTAKVKLDGEWVYINKNGKKVKAPTPPKLTVFAGRNPTYAGFGVFAVNEDINNPYEFKFVDKNGEKVTDQKILGKIAIHKMAFGEYFVGLGAIKKLYDQKILEYIAFNHPEAQQRWHCLERISNQAVLRHFVLYDNNDDVINIAINRLNDQKILVDLYLNDKIDISVKAKIVKKIKDKKYLEKLLLKNTDANLREAARLSLQRIKNNRSTVYNIIKNMLYELVEIAPTYSMNTFRQISGMNDSDVEKLFLVVDENYSLETKCTVNSDGGTEYGYGYSYLKKNGKTVIKNYDYHYSENLYELSGSGRADDKFCNYIFDLGSLMILFRTENGSVFEAPTRTFFSFDNGDTWGDTWGKTSYVLSTYKDSILPYLNLKLIKIKE
ncbi:MAG: WG repeat-containing protein [Prevotellaceae bacterium]|jgi:hypothetical protein|nr:WG repeat-containing protein [Prevotellaceae bacterium]